MIKNINSDGWIYINKIDSYGGVDLNISAGYQLTRLITSMQKHLDEHEREKALRESDPSVKLAWESYKMAVAMTQEPT